MLPALRHLVEVHADVDLVGRSTGQDEPPGTTAFSFLPSANAAADFVDHLLQVEAHRQFVDAGLVRRGR